MNNKTKIELEVLRSRICVNLETTQDELWLQSDTPHMHDHYVKRLDRDIKTYHKTLKSLLTPNKEYILNLAHTIIPYRELTNFVQFLYDNMVYGEYKSDNDYYFYDIENPQITSDDNKAEIIELLHLSILNFYVDTDGNTIINGFINGYDNESVNVKVNKNIFDTELICNISLLSI